MRSQQAWLIVVALGAGGCDLIFAPGDGSLPDEDDPVLDHPADGFGVEISDVDADGFLDHEDNCPSRPNSRQLDEDADAVGDACDNCVGVPNHTQADANEVADGFAADGIGDVCDPHPTSPADFIVGRYFVEGGDDPGDWIAVAGTWEIGTDEVREIDLAATKATLRYAAMLGPDATFEAGVAVTATGSMSPGEHQAAGMWIDVDGLRPHGGLCEVRRDGEEQPTVIAMTFDDGAQQVLSQAWYPTPIETTDSVLRVQRGPSTTEAGGSTSYLCSDPVITGEVGNPLWVEGKTPVAATDGYLGLSTTNASARFRYVVIYGFEP